MNVIKNNVLATSDDLQGLSVYEIENSIKNLNSRVEMGLFVPIGDGSMDNYIPLEDILFTGFNFRYIDGNILADLRPVREEYEGLVQLCSESGLNSLKLDIDGESECITFIPYIHEKEIILFNIRNFKNDVNKLHAKVVDEPNTNEIVNGDVRLELNINFRLPKNFKGDINDAILEVYRYRKSIKSHDKTFSPNVEDDIYTNWWNMVNTTDRRLFGSVAYHKFKDNEWESLL